MYNTNTLRRPLEKRIGYPRPKEIPINHCLSTFATKLCPPIKELDEELPCLNQQRHKEKPGKQPDQVIFI